MPAKGYASVPMSERAHRVIKVEAAKLGLTMQELMDRVVAEWLERRNRMPESVSTAILDEVLSSY